MNPDSIRIVHEIDAYMKQYSYKNTDWYVGIASDVRERLFLDHNVTENGGIWIFRKASSAREAREIEKAYLDTGHDGGSGGGDESTVYVYAYVKLVGTVR